MNSSTNKYILKNTNLFVDQLILEYFYSLFGPTTKKNHIYIYLYIYIIFFLNNNPPKYSIMLHNKLNIFSEYEMEKLFALFLSHVMV